VGELVFLPPVFQKLNSINHGTAALRDQNEQWLKELDFIYCPSRHKNIPFTKKMIVV